MNTWSLEYSFHLDTEHALITAKIHGMWKGDTAQKYQNDFKNEVKPLIGAPWARLIDLTNWKTSYPEVINIIGRHVSWAVDNGCVLSVYVINNPSTFKQLNQVIAKGGIKKVSEIFRTLPEAEKFLKEHWIAKRGQAPSEPTKPV